MWRWALAQVRELRRKRRLRGGRRHCMLQPSIGIGLRWLRPDTFALNRSESRHSEQIREGNENVFIIPEISLEIWPKPKTRPYARNGSEASAPVNAKPPAYRGWPHIGE